MNGYGYGGICVLSIHSLLMMHSLSSLSLQIPMLWMCYIYISFISHWSPLPQDMHSLFGYQSRNDVLKKKMYLCVLKLFLVLRSC
jgi:hypothetical protein